MAKETFDSFMKRREAAAKAYVRGNPDPVAALTVQHDAATFFGPDGGVKDGVEEVLADFRQGAGHFGPDSESHFEVLQQHSTGQTAFWTGFQHANIQMKDGKKVAMKLRVTEAFRLEDGEWRLAHRHADQAKG